MELKFNPDIITIEKYQCSGSWLVMPEKQSFLNETRSAQMRPHAAYVLGLIFQQTRNRIP